MSNYLLKNDLAFTQPIFIIICISVLVPVCHFTTYYCSRRKINNDNLTESLSSQNNSPSKNYKMNDIEKNNSDDDLPSYSQLYS